MLIDIQSLDDIKGEDYIIFKHSLTCPISAAAKVKVDAYVQNHPGVAVYMCIIQGHKQLMADIAQKYGITHESPQIIVVQGGVVLTTESHYGIQMVDSFFE